MQPAAAAHADASRVESLVSQTVLKEVDEDTLQDCPLTNQQSSVEDLLPLRLARVARADAGADVQRVWATLCSLATLEAMPVSYIWGDGDTYFEKERTIVDAGREWVETHAALHPLLAEALADGQLVKRAQTVTALWHALSAKRIEELRRSDAIRKQMGASQTHRTLTMLVRAFTTKNDTFAVFLSEPLDGLQRWQMCVVWLRWRAVLQPAVLTLARAQVHHHRHARAVSAARQQCVPCLLAHSSRAVPCG
jgi:hypothetical protein